MREEEESLLRPSSPVNNLADEAALSSSQRALVATPAAAYVNSRLAALDIFRGLTVALMILVDDAGGAFSAINHSPWFGVTVADFVMPFFLFIVGVSVSLVFKNVSSKLDATKKVLLRALKLFLLGVGLQGGCFHGRGKLTYGVDIHKVRTMGVLQRISIGYLLASLSEIWLVTSTPVESLSMFLKKYYTQWISVFFLILCYIVCLYGIYVPDWTFQIFDMTSKKPALQSVKCGFRGSLEPPCNAVGYLDRLLLGKSHMYQRPVYIRSKECSVRSPDYGPLPPESPSWCLAPFDPEGILSSFMAAATCLLGSQFGHVLIHYKSPTQRFQLWSFASFLLLLLGFFLQQLGIPSSKALYTISYFAITTGVSGFLLVIIYYIVDIKNIEKPTKILQWMGMNALLIYALAACNIFFIALQGFYWGIPENNLVDGTEWLLQKIVHSERYGTLLFVVLEILFWGFVAGFLHWKRIFVKL